MFSLEELSKIVKVFPNAWNNYLKELKEWKIWIPANEATLQCHLYSECLSIMRNNKLFKTPYSIDAEVKEIIKGKRADLSLGFLEEKILTFKAAVVVELKCYPDAELILTDIEKIREYTKGHAISSFFAMIGNPSINMEEVNQKLEEWGIKSDSKEEYYKWDTIKHPIYGGRTFVTLLVAIRGHIE